MDYAEAAAEAREMLAEFGQRGAVRRVERTGGGPSDPSGGQEVETDHPCLLVVLPVSQQAVDGTTIQTGDWRVIMEALDIDVTTSDRIICSEGDLSIVDPGRFAPAGAVVFYDAVARGT